MDTQKLDQTYIANTYARFPVTIVKGKGSLVWDDTGKEYIDLSTGIAVDIFGVADEEWMAAVTKQLGTLQHISNLYYTEPCVKLAQMLCEKTGMKKVFFGNSGAEANECAIKAARKWSEEKKGKDYSTVITLKNSFHGRTITTLAATGQDVFHHDFTPLTEGFVYAEPNDLADLEQLIKANKCAAGGAHLLHLDVMDGHFVPNISFGAPVIAGLSKVCDLPFDVHLMISQPLRYIDDYADAGADLITFHLESDDDPSAVIDKILARGCKPAIAIKPGTPAEAVLPYADRLAMVLVMTVEPGFGGQSFMADMMPKLTLLRSRYPHLDLQVDGGINLETVKAAAKAGANVFVAGSAVFKSADPAATIAGLCRAAQQAAE